MAFYVDNKSSFWFDREESLDMIDANKKYKTAGSKKIIVFKVPRYNGDNENKRIARVNIELDVIATCFEGKKLYYCSPFTFLYKFKKRPAPAKLNNFEFVHFTSADMEISFEQDSICVVDADSSQAMMINIIKQAKACKHVIFFVHESYTSLLSILENAN